MIIIGAGGFASELVQIIESDDLVFFDNISEPSPIKFLDQFPIISTEEELKERFLKDPKFALGLGRPQHRKSLADLCQKLGGQIISVVSKTTTIGNYNVNIAKGVCILDGVRISNNTTIGEGTLIYYNSVITHDCVVGEYCELSPGATLLGHSQVGNYTHIGANVTVLPGVRIGSNCIVGAGAVVTKDVPDNTIAVGIPAVIKPRGK